MNLKKLFWREDGKPITANPVILFPAILLTALFFVFLLSISPGTVLLPLDKITAAVFAFLTGLTGLDIKHSDINLWINFRGVLKTISIGYGCDGALAYLILASAILPFPCKLKAKITGLLTGLLFVFVMNQVRVGGLVVALFFVSDEKDFSFYHTVVGQIFAIVMIFLFWNYWAVKTVKDLQTQSS